MSTESIKLASFLFTDGQALGLSSKLASPLAVPAEISPTVRSLVPLYVSLERPLVLIALKGTELPAPRA